MSIVRILEQFLSRIKKKLGKKTLLKTIGRAPPHIGYNKLSIVNK